MSFHRPTLTITWLVQNQIQFHPTSRVGFVQEYKKRSSVFTPLIDILY